VSPSRLKPFLFLTLSLAACHPRVSTPSFSDQPHPEPDVSGVTHVVRSGQTLYRIARTYGVDERELAELNDVERPEDLKTGQALFIPGAERVLDVPLGAPGPVQRDRERKTLAKDTRYAWPVHGVLVSRFGVRGSEQHDGIDIAAPEGTPVMAARAGKVIFAGEQRGYGRLAVIDHGDGEATVYAHCSQVLVQVGDLVRAGQIVGKVGRTGRATGPHLHFEVRLHAQPRNPLFYLPEG
jgi:murein DD-endopeptidase MepM/ murein hydrolase activator NlpD